MANTELALSQSFIEQQQRRLEALQKELLGAEGKALGNERAYQEAWRRDARSRNFGTKRDRPRTP